jgi:hypothetical protein
VFFHGSTGLSVESDFPFGLVLIWQIVAIRMLLAGLGDVVLDGPLLPPLHPRRDDIDRDQLDIGRQRLGLIDLIDAAVEFDHLADDIDVSGLFGYREPVGNGDHFLCHGLQSLGSDDCVCRMLCVDWAGYWSPFRLFQSVAATQPAISARRFCASACDRTRGTACQEMASPMTSRAVVDERRQRLAVWHVGSLAMYEE